MKRKLINGLMLAAALTATTGTFTSCKDSYEDLRNEWHNDDAALAAKIDALQQVVNTLDQYAKQSEVDLISNKLDEVYEAVFGTADLEGLKEQVRKNAEDIADLKRQQLTEAELTQKISDAVASGIAEYMNNLTPEQLAELGIVSEDYLEQKLAQFSTVITDIVNLQDQIDTMQGLIDALTQRLDNMTPGSGCTCGLDEDKVKALIDAAIANLLSDVDALKNDVATLKNIVPANLQAQLAKISEIQSQLSDLQTIRTNASHGQEAYLFIKKNSYNLNTLLELTNDLKNAVNKDIPGLKSALEKLKVKTEDLVNEVQALNDKVDTKVADLQRQITDLLGDLTTLQEDLDNKFAEIEQAQQEQNQKIAANEQAITDLKEKMMGLFGKVFDRINSLITGILTQGTYNPLFGTFSLPIGVQSNMLLGYYGTSDHPEYMFPSSITFATYDNEAMLTDLDMQMLGRINNLTTIDENALLVNENENHEYTIGKVYTTINPNNISFENSYLDLVNSRDEAAPVTLKMRKSDELLSFGYTRAENGFYEADAVVPANLEDIEKIKLDVVDGLKDSAKDLLKDFNRSNLFGLLKAVYDQFNGKLPAYGLKASWEDYADATSTTKTTFAVYSKYDIAATTFRPLSFTALKGESVGSRRLPIISPLKESILDLNPDDYKFTLNDPNVTLNFTFDSITLTATGDLALVNAGIWIGEGADKKWYPIEGGEVVGLDKFLGEINSSLNNQIGTWNTKLQNAFKEAINNVIASLQKDVDKSMDKMITDIQDQVNGTVGDYIGKFNSFIDKYNKLAKKLNNVLENPNHYLQPTIVYAAKDNNYHFLSNDVNHPTVFKRANGNAVTIYPTTYTGEILTPAYKKFIGCTNAYQNGNSAQGGNSGLTNMVNMLNNQPGMKTVFNGDTRSFSLPVPADLKSGVTYEIVYVAVDYHGTTVTTRYYFTVE